MLEADRYRARRTRTIREDVSAPIDSESVKTSRFDARAAQLQ